MTTDLRVQLQSSLGSAYTVERELGGGGMSRTYVAHEAALGRKVVVKVLSPELAAGVSVERFRREVLLAAKLQHPHIVPVLSSGNAGGLPWFTMPFVEGESLRVRLGRGPLAIGQATGILRDVARALEFAHSHGVVHRDIKPDNVLLAGNSATVTDFGIAKAISAARTTSAGATLTMAGTSIGTPAYMAPEQAAGDPDADHRSDLYAFGCMAYELLTGRPPFVATSPAKLLGAHLGEQARDVRELRPDTPAALADLVMRCLAKEPGDRPQEAADLARVLDTVASSGVAAAPAAVLGPRIRPVRAIALWAVATALVAVTAWAATAVIGLPDWVLPGSLGVMLAGLPVIALTAWVQREASRAYTTTPTLTPGGTVAAPGTMATLAMKASPHVSWRRTWIGGAAAVGGFAALVVAFMVMRALGIGPMGSLIGAGKLGEGETLVVADFRAPPGDSLLGATVAEAIRTDLSQSTSLDVMSRATVREILQLMQRPVEAPVTSAIAREIATREGAKVLLDGEVARLGRSYVVSARLVSSIDGSELARFGETAADDDALIGALGDLSRGIRGKIGESLRSIRETKALERVTTPSLSALRKYVEGVRYAEEVGDEERGLEALQEAVALDTSFAMAWRKIAVVVGNMGTDRPRAMDAAVRAFRHRDRLSETERLLTEANYYTSGPEPDRAKALAAYEAVLESHPEHSTAANNAAVLYEQNREYARALPLYRIALREERPFGSAFTNIIGTQIRLNDIAGAESTQALYRQRLPDHEGLWEGEWAIHWARGEYDAADSLARATFRGARRTNLALVSSMAVATSALLHGKVRDGVRWQAEGHGAVMRAAPSAERRLLAAIDSARAIAFFFGRVAEARQIAREALERTPMGSMPAAARPWNQLGELASLMRDPALANEALDGFMADKVAPPVGTWDGAVARMRAWVAMAEGRHVDAVRELQEADRLRSIFDRLALIKLADAYDLAGQPDSALAHYERFLSSNTAGLFPPLMFIDGTFLAGAYKRAGELYEAKGDTARAESRYSTFIQLWKDADPELQPRVREVRERLVRLRRGRG